MRRFWVGLGVLAAACGPDDAPATGSVPPPSEREPDASSAAPADAAAADAAISEDAAGVPLDPFATLPATVADAEALRRARWAAPQDDGQGVWDIVYDGQDDPSAGHKSPYLWDVPCDDDWDDPPHSFLWNTPAPGFVTVDRTTDPIDYKAGRFTRRDEFASHATGFTLSVRVRLLPTSNPDSFFITYVNDYGSLTALLSPDGFKVGGGPDPTGAAFVAQNNTGNYRQYWFSQAAGAATVNVYSDTQATPVTAALDPVYRVGTDENVAFPYVLVGDNSNTPTRNAAFVIDDIRYRRGGDVAPLSHLEPTPPRAPPSPLPEAASGPETFTRALEGDAVFPQDPGGIPSAESPTCFSAFCTRGDGAAWTLHTDPDGTSFVELDNRDGAQAGIRVENAPGLTNEGDLTFELRFRVLPDSERRGFGFMHLDELGSFGVALDPDGIEAFQGVKPFGYQRFAIDLTDRFHVLRLVRKAGELYTQYYLDGHAVPVVVDEHLDASTEHRGFPVHPLVQLGYIGLPERDRRAHVQLDYVRWADHAWAPPTGG